MYPDMIYVLSLIDRYNRPTTHEGITMAKTATPKPQYWGHGYRLPSGKWRVEIAAYRYAENAEYQLHAVNQVMASEVEASDPFIFAVDQKDLKGTVSAAMPIPSPLGEVYAIVSGITTAASFTPGYAALVKAIILKDIAESDAVEITARKAVINRV